MKAEIEYSRIAMVPDRNQRTILVNQLENNHDFNINERIKFNDICWKGNLFVPQIQVF